MSLTAPPFVPGALELDDGWADNARRIGLDGVLEALKPQRKLQRVRTGSRSPRGSDADLSEEAFDAGMAAAATAGAGAPPTAAVEAVFAALAFASQAPPCEAAPARMALLSEENMLELEASIGSAESEGLGMLTVHLSHLLHLLAETVMTPKR